MKIKEFIEKSIEGGWVFNHKQYDFCENINDCNEIIFFDPKAWEAVGKVEGWEAECSKKFIQGFSHKGGCEACAEQGWVMKMHDMIDALCEGKSLEEYIETL